MVAPTPPFENAFVLGAGLGTRLRTLTEHRPKPLIPIFGKPLISFAFDQLIAAGIRRLVVNTHHCHEAYQVAFPEGVYRGVPLFFEHEPALLETAGGIKNAEPHLKEKPFIVYNGDIFSSLPLEKALAHHAASGNEVTLVLRSEGGPLHISLDETTGRVVDIADRLRLEGFPHYLFTGIYVVEPSFLRRIPTRTKISVIPIFMKMIETGQALGGVVIDDGCWWDLGTREKYLEVHRTLAAAPELFAEEGWPVRLDPAAQVAPDARLAGIVAAGPGASIGSGAQVTDCILWEGAQVLPGSVLERCIVTGGRTASGTHADTDF